MFNICVSSIIREWEERERERKSMIEKKGWDWTLGRLRLYSPLGSFHFLHRQIKFAIFFCSMYKLCSARHNLTSGKYELILSNTITALQKYTSTHFLNGRSMQGHI